MKILFFSHYPHLMGANRSLFSLIEGLIEKGVIVQVWCNESGAFSELLLDKGINCRIFPYHNWAATFLHPSFWLLPYHIYRNNTLMPSLIEETKAFNPNIIHTNSTVLGIGAQIADELNIPHVWHIREFPWKQYRKCFFPSINKFHRFLAKSKKVIAVSDALRQEIGKGHDLSNWSVIYNGVASKQELSTNMEGKSENEQMFRFLFVGLLHPSKNQEEAIEAFAKVVDQYKDISLHIIGDGQRFYTQKLKWLVRIYKLEKQVVFRGFVKDMSAEYQNADALLICSPNEGMGRVTVEAMSFGLPVIGYNGGGTPELITNEKDGLIYNNGASDLADSMVRLIKNRSLCAQMGVNGREKVLSEFTTEHYVNQVYDVFREVYPF